MKLFKKIPLTPDEKRERKQRRLYAVLSGALLGLSFPPVPFPITVFFALVPYFFIINKTKRLIDINRFTYLTAFIFCIISIYWVGGWEDATDPFLMIGGTLLMFINPVFFLIPSTLFYFARKNFGSKTAFYLLPLFWVTYEYAYMITDASFPWLTLGNSLPYFTSFIQIADIIGALGLSLLILYINLFLFFAFRTYLTEKKIASIYIGAAVLIFAVPQIYGFYRINTFEISDKTIKVGLIQPNLNPWDKWEAGNLTELTDLYLGLSKQAVDDGAELVIWPETSLPVYLLSGMYSSAVDKIEGFVRTEDVYLLTGMPDIFYYPSEKEAPPDVKRTPRGLLYTSYNGALFFNPHEPEIKRYGKMKLVPFGERVPFVDVLPFLGNFIKWEVGISGWNVGKEKTLFPYVNGYDTVKINPLICYESVYPEFVSDFVHKGSGIISIITNDSWYGELSGPYQHKEIAVLRAVENRRTVVRAANGGISCIINPLGVTTAETGLYVKTYLTVEAPVQNGYAFFTLYPWIISYAASFITVLSIFFFILNKIFKFKIINNDL
jgi:apolipoprotein N-acyltransferase